MRKPVALWVPSQNGFLHRSVATPEVDRVDFAQEADRFPSTEFLRPGGERSDVLREAAPAEADARAQVSSPDPGVVAERVGEQSDVGARRFRDLRHRVDERDLGGEEGIGRALHEFGRREVRDQEGRPGVDARGVHLSEHTDGALSGGIRLGADHEAIRCQGVVHRPSLAEELGVPHECGSGGDDALRQSCGGSHRHGRLARHHVSRTQVGEQAVERRVDVVEVRGVTSRNLRGPDGEEVHLRTRGVRHPAAEAQPSRAQAVGEELREPRLEEWRRSGGQSAHLLLIDVDADDVVSDRGHGGGVHGTEVPAADH